MRLALSGSFEDKVGVVEVEFGGEFRHGLMTELLMGEMGGWLTLWSELGRIRLSTGLSKTWGWLGVGSTGCGKWVGQIWAEISIGLSKSGLGG